jgi:3-phenylpropionate/trans-cinnamate dioxygenase ferredoxin reductase subunit
MMAVYPQDVQNGVVIVGAGHAGGRAAQQLRGFGFDGPIKLIGAEPVAPYERPPLSKSVLLNAGSEDQIFLNYADWYADNDVDLHTNTEVTAFDPQAKSLVTSCGCTLPYDHAILATGGRLRPLDVPGADLAGVSHLKTLSDAIALRANLTEGVRLVIIGGGFIGLEVAASASALGAKVKVVEATDRLMGRAVPPVISSLFRDIHTGLGTQIELGNGVTRIHGDESKVTEVELENGRRLPTDLVVVGIGILPETGLAKQAGLAIGNGILVDADCRTTDPHIFAIGDVACQNGLRLESWQNAEAQAARAAAAITGQDAPTPEPIWFWSDQSDTNLQILGQPSDWNDLLVRGSLGDGSAMLFKVNAGRLEGVIGINSKRDMLLMRKLLAHDGKIDSDVLTDTQLPLKKSVIAAMRA